MPRTISIFLTLLFATRAFAFPELGRHGYPQCSSCHVSPGGGGVLSEYGRSLSKEVLSTFSSEGEEKFLYGLVDTPKWLALGGDYRSVYLYQDNPQFREGQSIFMQADLEAAFKIDLFSIVGTFGYVEAANKTKWNDDLISRRHYVLYEPENQIIKIRGGRFFSTYGLGIPDHATVIKKQIGFDQARETYNIETLVQSDKYQLFLTALFGRPDRSELDREKGAQISFYFTGVENQKFGLSFGQTHSSIGKRTLIGPNAIVKILPQLYYMGEFDLQWQNQPFKGTKRGFVEYQRLGFEPRQGFHLYASQSLAKIDFEKPGTLQNSFGLGFKWFPRPHFEFDLEWQKVRATSLAPTYQDLATLLFHFYL